MGLDKAKSLLEVKDGQTFLDLIAKQIDKFNTDNKVAIKFMLMNSFSTSADTVRVALLIMSISFCDDTSEKRKSQLASTCVATTQ